MAEAGPLLQKFLRGHPRVFGALLLVIGLLQLAFGVILILSPCVYRDELGTHFCSASLLILTGIITLIAYRFPNMTLVKVCLAIFIFCMVIVGTINIFYLIDLVYDPRNRNVKCASHDFCMVLYQRSHYCTGMRAIVLIFTSLGFFICLSLAAFGCKAVCRQNSDEDVPVAILKNTPSSHDITAEPDRATSERP